MSHNIHAHDTIKLLPAESVVVTSSNSRQNGEITRQPPILLVSCSDYKFPDEITDFMNKRGALDKYDHITITGGSLGIDNLLYPNLKSAFITQLKLLRGIHNFYIVTLLDHRDCELFKSIHGNSHVHDHQSEYKLHKHHLENVKKLILEIYPDIQVEMLLMNQDGSVLTVQ